MASPYLSNYRNGEYLQYMRDVLTFINTNPNDTSMLTEATDALSSIVKQMEVVYPQSRGNSRTKAIAALDARRNDAVLGIKGLVRSLTKHYDVTTATSAELVLKRIKKDGNDISTYSYQEKSAVLNRLIKDLTTDSTLVTAIHNLTLIEDWLTELETINTLFIETYLQRIKENAIKASKTTATQLRIEATKAYRQLMVRLNAYITITNSKELRVILNRINILTKHYNQVVYTRRQTVVKDKGVSISSSDFVTPTSNVQQSPPIQNRAGITTTNPLAYYNNWLRLFRQKQQSIML